MPGITAMLGPGEARAFAESLLRPLVEHDIAGRGDLVNSLRAWLTHHGQWDPSAAALGVHRHTLRHRIRTVGHCSAATWTHRAPAGNCGWRWKSLLGNGDHGFAVGNEPLDDHPSAAGLRSRPHWAPLRHGAGVTAIDVQHTPGSTLTGGLSTACPAADQRERRWGSSPRAGRAFGGMPWPGVGPMVPIAMDRDSAISP